MWHDGFKIANAVDRTVDRGVLPLGKTLKSYDVYHQSKGFNRGLIVNRSFILNYAGNSESNTDYY